MRKKSSLSSFSVSFPPLSAFLTICLHGFMALDFDIFADTPTFSFLASVWAVAVFLFTKLPVVFGTMIRHDMIRWSGIE